MPRLLLAFMLVTIVMAGCGQPQDTEETAPPEAAASAEAEVKSQVVPPPGGVRYTIYETETIPGLKRSLTVVLDDRISRKDLSQLARHLKSRDPYEYEKTFIVYYLSEEDIGSATWATTHFTPDLSVRILGLELEDVKPVVASTPAVPGRETIGRWASSGPLAATITLYSERGSKYIHMKFKDGSSMTESVIERGSRIGRRFDLADGSQWGDHYIIAGSGDLQLRDNQGLISTARKMK